jgi:short-subunit dehydrogenase
MSIPTVTSATDGHYAAMDVNGARVLVTGASSGIGAALARRLAERGATVGLVGRRRDRLEEVLADCRQHAPDSQLWAVDLADLDAAEALALDAWDAFGHLDVLVNNAGIPKRRPVTELTVAEIDETMRVNFEAPVRMTLAVLPRMLERGRGSIVNVSSVGGRTGIFHEAAYCASKFALCGWTEAMAVDLWDDPIEVRLVLPGPIDTEIWDRPGNERAAYDGPKSPPEEAADGIIAAIEGDRFETYVPDMKAVIDFKQQDIDGFLEGSAAMGKGSS